MHKNHFLVHFFIIITAFIHGALYSQDVEIISEGETRTFKINLPNDTSEPLPLMILMHGLGETNSNMYGVANYFSNRNFIAIRPQSGSYLNSSGSGYTTLWNALADTQKLDDVQFNRLYAYQLRFCRLQPNIYRRFFEWRLYGLPIILRSIE
jgi:poly(3-hydroxybutyrate) depolymerase